MEGRGAFGARRVVGGMGWIGARCHGRGAAAGYARQGQDAGRVEAVRGMGLLGLPSGLDGGLRAGTVCRGCAGMGLMGLSLGNDGGLRAGPDRRGCRWDRSVGPAIGACLGREPGLSGKAARGIGPLNPALAPGRGQFRALSGKRLGVLVGGVHRGSGAFIEAGIGADCRGGWRGGGARAEGRGRAGHPAALTRAAVRPHVAALLPRAYWKDL